MKTQQHYSLIIELQRALREFKGQCEEYCPYYTYPTRDCVWYNNPLSADSYFKNGHHRIKLHRTQVTSCKRAYSDIAKQKIIRRALREGLIQ